MITLSGPDKPYSFKVSLKLISELEGGYGSLYQMAEDLLNQSFPLSSMAGVLKVLFRHAGCAVEENILDDFIIQQPCADILASVLLDILGPVERLGAVTTGELLPENRENEFI